MAQFAGWVDFTSDHRKVPPHLIRHCELPERPEYTDKTRWYPETEPIQDLHPSCNNWSPASTCIHFFANVVKTRNDKAATDDISESNKEGRDGQHQDDEQDPPRCHKSDAGTKEAEIHRERRDLREPTLAVFVCLEFVKSYPTREAISKLWSLKPQRIQIVMRQCFQQVESFSMVSLIVASFRKFFNKAV